MQSCNHAVTMPCNTTRRHRCAKDGSISFRERWPRSGTACEPDARYVTVRWITLSSSSLRVAWILDYLDVAAHRREIAGPWLGYLPRQAQR